MKVAIVGASGVVGKELQALLTERSFPHRELLLFNSSRPPSFSGVDLAFFCVPAEQAKHLIPEARAANVLCIDSSSHFRHDPSVPLVIPEINPEALAEHQGVIASPNCTTTLMLMPLAPVHQKWTIKRIIAATYQAVSGAGARAMEELTTQTRASLDQQPLQVETFPSPCAFNVFPHESAVGDDGFVEEERKMWKETHKILGSSDIGVCATCIRVPVLRSHSIALNVELERPFTKEELQHVLSQAKGVEFSETRAWTALDATRRNHVVCGKLRLDPTHPRAFTLWVVGDQLLKGAALNMVQIAEELLCVQVE